VSAALPPNAHPSQMPVRRRLWLVPATKKLDGDNNCRMANMAAQPAECSRSRYAGWGKPDLSAVCRRLSVRTPELPMRGSKRRGRSSNTPWLRSGAFSRFEQRPVRETGCYVYVVEGTRLCGVPKGIDATRAYSFSLSNHAGISRALLITRHISM
jgi:hypothetical protein